MLKYSRLPILQGKSCKWYILEYIFDPKANNDYGDYLDRKRAISEKTQEIVDRFELYVLKDGVIALTDEMATAITLALPQHFKLTLV